MSNKKLLIAFMILALIAIPITIYLTFLDFNPDIGGVCSIDSTFDCVSVSKSAYSKLFGVPVAIWGFLTYTLLFVLSLGLLKRWNFRKIHKRLTSLNVYKLMSFITSFGLAFSLYLTHAELFVIKAFCIN